MDDIFALHMAIHAILDFLPVTIEYSPFQQIFQWKEQLSLLRHRLQLQMPLYCIDTASHLLI